MLDFEHKIFVKFHDRKWTNAIAARYHRTVPGEFAGLGTFQATLPQPLASGVNARMRRKRVPLRAHAAYVLALFVVAMAALTGCGDGKLPLYPVTGTVLVDGQPAQGAMVIFCPVEGSSPPELLRERPFGNAGPDGKFLVTTFLKDDGIPAGEYKILVQWAVQGAAYDQRSGPVDRLRGRYMNLENTPLTAKITSDSLELPPFDLKTR